MRPRRPTVLALLIVLLAAPPAVADVTFGLVGDRTSLATGDTVMVSVEVTESGDPFNGYDAIFSFDSTFFEPVIPDPPADGEGPLFTEACGLRFLNIGDDRDSSRVRVSHVVLCAGLSLTGPGRTYTLGFRALDASGWGVISLTDGTQAYDAGELVETRFDDFLVIAVNATTDTPPAGRPLELNAVPNPFNPATELRFDLPEPGPVSLVLFDASGRRVDTLFDRRLPAGPARVRWDGRDAQGNTVGSGLYFARLRTTRGEALSRLVLVR